MSSKIFAAGNWERLVSPQRKERMNPVKFFNIASPDSKDVWADIGCGPGYFTLPLAERVDKVIATDISLDMLDACRTRAQEANLGNIEFMESDSEKTTLADEMLDGILLVNVYHEFPEVTPVIDELKRILKPRASFYVIDWRAEPMESGPPMDHRIPETQVIKDFEAAGFELAGQHEIYAQNYVLQFIKKD